MIRRAFTRRASKAGSEPDGETQAAMVEAATRTRELHRASLELGWYPVAASDSSLGPKIASLSAKTGQAQDYASDSNVR